MSDKTSNAVYKPLTAPEATIDSLHRGPNFVTATITEALANATNAQSVNVHPFPSVLSIGAATTVPTHPRTLRIKTDAARPRGSPGMNSLIMVILTLMMMIIPKPVKKFEIIYCHISKVSTLLRVI